MTINDLEIKLTEKLKMYELFMQNLQNLSNYNIQLEKDLQVSLLESLKSIGRGSNESLKESMADNAVVLMNKMFNVWEDVISEVY